MDRVILHCDMNNFYASVECARHPELANVPLVVGGDESGRHGIVLAKNYIAKSYGIKTGEPLVQARRKCAGLVTVTADLPLYLKYSKRALEIYSRYTDRIESFGIDECWLDVTGSAKLFGSGKQIADELRAVIRKELGCTISVGVSWNKIFAKLGSDMQKPDATTVISRQNYRDCIHALPVEDLLYVGKATRHKLNAYSIFTIGDLAAAKPQFLQSRLGKWGLTIWSFACGLDQSEVAAWDGRSAPKSVGNSATAARDLVTRNDVLMMVTIMAESVGRRLREQGLKGQVVSLHLRDRELDYWDRQVSLPAATSACGQIIAAAMELFDGHQFDKPLRSVGVTVSALTAAACQMRFDVNPNIDKLEATLDLIKDKYGHAAVSRAILMTDPKLTGINPKEQNVAFPRNYF